MSKTDPLHESEVATLTDVKRRSGSIWVWMATALTLIYFLALSPILLSEEACGVPPATCTFVQSLQALTLNELGDTLAGLFAPVAFLWLAAAVLVQAQELKAQREELHLTRREFELSRAVAREAKDETAAQAAAARETGRFIKRQTEIMSAQAEHQFATGIDQSFLDLLGNLVDVLRDANVSIFLGRPESTDKDEYVRLWLKQALPHDRMAAALQASREALTELERVREEIAAGRCAIRPRTRHRIDGILALLDQMIELQPKGSAKTQALAKAIQVQNLRDTLAFVRSNVTLDELD